ncbi:MAG: hypothetical protein ACLFTA_03095 [Candidatus Nanohaloarchaea archaeon]
MTGLLKKKILPWFHFPGTYKIEDEERFKERDSLWSDIHLFQGDWVTIQTKLEWYESPNVPTIYKEHKYVFGNIDMGRAYEKFYYEHRDTGEFEAVMDNSEDLPSDKGSLRITPSIKTKAPPGGENNFAFVEYQVDLDIKYDMPSGIQLLPRILAYPLNKLFKKAFMSFIAEEMVEYDGEYARQRLYDYFQYIRKYHGEEPLQSKTRESEFKPAVKDGVFFQ